MERAALGVQRSFAQTIFASASAFIPFIFVSGRTSTSERREVRFGEFGPSRNALDVGL